MCNAIATSSSIKSRSNYNFDDSATVMRYSCVCMLSTARPSLTHEIGQGIFNVRNDFKACCAHEVETGGGELAQVLIRKN